jgi:outer membrane protein
MMKKMIISMLLTGFSLCVLAQQNPVSDTTLKTLIQQAVTNFPRIKELEEQLRVSDVKAELLHSNYQPTLYGDASYRFLAPSPAIPFGGNLIKFQPYNNYTAGLTLNQLVYDFGKTRTQLDKNNSEQLLTQDNIDNNKNSIAYMVAQIYYGILFTDKAIRVQQDQLKILHENERVIQAKLKNGDAIEYDLLTTQVRTSNSDNLLKELQGSQEKNFIMMQWLTGSDLKNNIGPGAFEENIPLVTSSGNWKKNNAEAKIINRKIELLDYDRQLAMVNNRPTIFASATGGVRNGIQPEINQMKLAGGAGVGLSIPIFSAARPKLQQKLTDVNIETARLSLNTLEATINKDLASVQQDYITIQQKLENSKVTVEQANKAFKLAQTRYKEGLITNVELILIQTSVEDADLSVLKYRYQLLMDKLESHKIIGTKLYE